MLEGPEEDEEEDAEEDGQAENIRVILSLPVIMESGSLPLLWFGYVV